MNLYFRLILAFLRAYLRPTTSLFEPFITKHVVMPNDLDLLGHVNNGRYFTITDLVRVELLVNAGLWQAMRKRKQYAVMAGETIQFRKALMPFQRYEVHTVLKGWDEKFFYVEHRFQSSEGIHALALVKVCVVGKERPTPAELFSYIHQDIPLRSSNLNEIIDTWNESTLNHWRRAS